MGRAVLFLYQPVLCNILPIYCLFLCMVPFICWFLKKRLWWLVALGSVGLWVVPQLDYVSYLPSFFFKINDPSDGSLGTLSRQLVFVMGLLLARHFLPLNSWTLEFLQDYSGAAHVGPLRVADLLILALLANQFAPQLTPVLESRWLGLIGRYSLPVFAFHTVITYLVVGMGLVSQGVPEWQKGAVAIVAALLLYLPARAWDWLCRRSARKA